MEQGTSHEPGDGGGKREEGRPHPILLPQGEGIVVPASGQTGRPEFAPVLGRSVARQALPWAVGTQIK